LEFLLISATHSVIKIIITKIGYEDVNFTDVSFEAFTAVMFQAEVFWVLTPRLYLCG
jgi:hypothetical protein